MAKAKVTKQDVYKAITKLIKRKEEPTISNVRYELGSVGSYSTILKYIQQWRVENKKPVKNMGSNKKENEDFQRGFKFALTMMKNHIKQFEK